MSLEIESVQHTDPKRLAELAEDLSAAHEVQYCLELRLLVHPIPVCSLVCISMCVVCEPAVVAGWAQDGAGTARAGPDSLAADIRAGGRTGMHPQIHRTRHTAVQVRRQQAQEVVKQLQALAAAPLPAVSSRQPAPKVDHATPGKTSASAHTAQGPKAPVGSCGGKQGTEEGGAEEALRAAVAAAQAQSPLSFCQRNPSRVSVRCGAQVEADSLRSALEQAKQGEADALNRAKVSDMQWRSGIV